ncbi:probable serine/threonine-protein kinase pats1 [Saccostrea cucullata]|uniref:probable serine/threonine-protein kinase pats1 n=1 Tax=Saccostrea cuccullata TaxID=36930 RepID=UPI002ED62A4E
MYELFMEKLQLDIITHCTISDRDFHPTINEHFHVPLEILRWDLEARMQFLELDKKGETQFVHHARGMIVGCAEAGKTTLLKRLQKKDIKDVEQTRGLEVHEEMFEINDKTQSLQDFPKATTLNTTEIKHRKGSSKKTLTFFDFAGQCVYYACHQIYLTRRAFYVVVVDASKRLDQKVDKKVCDQDGSVFSGWTYGEYFLFWINSIHTFCDTESGEAPTILIVATHWENAKQYKSKKEFIMNLQKTIPRHSRILSQYIREDFCFFLRLPVEPIQDLEKRIVEIGTHRKWTERIPKEWVCFEIDIHQRKNEIKIMNTAEIVMHVHEYEKAFSHHHTQRQHIRKQEMLRYFHDAGKILYFNDEVLNRSVIIDVQWFVDAFKHIITDNLISAGIKVALEDWKEYYETGHLKDRDLMEIWKYVDKKLHEERTHDTIINLDNEDDALSDTNLDFPDHAFYKPGAFEHVEINKKHKHQDFSCHKTKILKFMQRLGLVASCGDMFYIPCMNRKDFDEEMQNEVREAHVKSSILIFKFELLPYFYFFRLVVACMQKQNWKVLKSHDRLCLYRNVALFLSRDHHVAIAVNTTSIQLQVYQPVHWESLDVRETKLIQTDVEKSLMEVTSTFHRENKFTKGFSCKSGNK